VTIVHEVPVIELTVYWPGKFASHPTTHAPLSSASTDLLRSFAIDYSNFRDLFYIYRRVVVGKKKPIGSTGKEIHSFGFGGKFCPAR
jgi:hypothetical protein